MQAFFIYKQAQLNAVGFNEPKKFPRTLRDAFPEIFEKPKGIPMPSFLRGDKNGNR